MITSYSSIGPRVRGGTVCVLLVLLLTYCTALHQAGLWHLAIGAPEAAAVSLPSGTVPGVNGNAESSILATHSPASRKPHHVDLLPATSKEAHILPHADTENAGKRTRIHTSARAAEFLQLTDDPPAATATPPAPAEATQPPQAPAAALVDPAATTAPPAAPASLPATARSEGAHVVGPSGLLLTAAPGSLAAPAPAPAASPAAPPAAGTAAAASGAPVPAPEAQTQSAVVAAMDPASAAASPGTPAAASPGTPAAAFPGTPAVAASAVVPQAAEAAQPGVSAPAPSAPTVPASAVPMPAEAWIAAPPLWPASAAPPTAAAPPAAAPSAALPAEAPQATAPPAESNPAAMAPFGANSDSAASAAAAPHAVTPDSEGLSSRAKLASLFIGSPGSIADAVATSAEALEPSVGSTQTAPIGSEEALPLSTSLDSIGGQSVAPTITSGLNNSFEPLDKNACFNHCSCTPVVVISSIIFAACFFSVLVTSIMMGTLFSRGFVSSSFFFGGGYAILAAAFFGLATGMICGGVIAGCWPAALSFGGGTLAFACSIVLLGRRGAWLGAVGGAATGGSIAGLVEPGAFPISLGCVMGLLLGIVVGFAPIFRDLKMNSRYIRHGLHGHDSSSSRSSQRDYAKSTDSLISQRAHRMTPSTAASRSASGLKLRNSPSRTTDAQGTSVSRAAGLHEDQVADGLASPTHSLDSGAANVE
ncbi:hypothetical protein Efla_005923 [Eimeria flavescens]